MTLQIEQAGINLTVIGGSQGAQIGRTKRAAMDQVLTSPGKDGLSENLFDNDISHEAGMPSVAVGIAMDGDDTVLEANGDFIFWKRLVLYPVSTIIQQPESWLLLFHEFQIFYSEI